MRRAAERAPAPCAAAGLVLAAALLTGCGLGGEDGPGGGGRPGGDPPAPAPRRSGPMVKQAWSMTNGSPTKIEVTGVERHADRSVLRFHLTNLGQAWNQFSFGTSLASAAFAEIDFLLLDPVGRKLYHPLVDEGGKGKAVGSVARTFPADPGVRYEAVLHFPPLPKDVRTVTLITPSTAGEFTGVPVVEGRAGRTGPEAPVSAPGDDPPRGSTVALPVREAQGATPHWVDDLYGLASGEVTTTATSRDQQRIGLRADVLFDFDKATLTPRARQVLDDVAAQTRAEADPARPPIVITGHTDGRGTPGYNVPLSRKRADAVLRELQARLGTAYQYRAEGRGETQPVAKEGGADDEQARARNRRVEVSYQFRQERTRTTTGTTTAPVSPAAGSGPPAAFRPDDGRTVASRTADFTAWGVPNKRRIDVKPFYRDGAYLVAVFEITNLGPRALNVVDSYAGSGVGKFGAFSVRDPASKITYQGVSPGPPTKPDGSTNIDRLDPGWATFRVDPNTANRGFFYVPAPPPDVRSVTFDAGPFGQIPNVPIE
ncbi:OmpA family protein [Actinomadura kijaniata]|uniref:OmpA family protein n=1 Tax=Actinomadura kijaniata TaxID=46161 RepID=UPI003F1977DE